MSALDWSRVRRSGSSLPPPRVFPPPTEKQLRYIGHVAAKLNADPPKPVSRADASDLIAMLERSVRLRRRRPAPR